MNNKLKEKRQPPLPWNSGHGSNQNAKENLNKLVFFLKPQINRRKSDKFHENEYM